MPRKLQHVWYGSYVVMVPPYHGVLGSYGTPTIWYGYW